MSYNIDAKLMKVNDFNLAQNIILSPYMQELMADEVFCASLIRATSNNVWYKYCPTHSTDTEQAIALLSLDFSHPEEHRLWSESAYFMSNVVMQVRKEHHNCQHSANYWRDMSHLYSQLSPDVATALKYLGWVVVP